MNSQDALTETQAFLNIMKEMSLQQMWTVVTFVFSMAIKNTPSAMVPEVIDNLMKEAAELEAPCSGLGTGTVH
jgi:hypothetical protein